MPVLDNETYELVGRVTLASAELEYVAKETLCVFLGGELDKIMLLVADLSMARVEDQLGRLCGQLGASDLDESLGQWLGQAERLRGHRNDIAHGIWALTTTAWFHDSENRDHLQRYRFGRRGAERGRIVEAPESWPVSKLQQLVTDYQASELHLIAIREAYEARSDAGER